MKRPSATTIILWIIYLFLLAVLLPHTAWAFRAFEPVDPASLWELWPGFTSADLVSYVAALAFEAAIAVLTHKLAKHIEQTAKATRGKPWGAALRIRYANSFFAGLMIATAVSSLANLAHAVEFAGSLAIFAEWGIPPGVYVVAFGGILPVVSLLFARVLSNVNEAEGQDDPALVELRATVADLRRQLKDTEARARAAEVAKSEAERQAQKALEGAGKLRLLLADDKAERIRAARALWPGLAGAAIVAITGAAPSYVSEILRESASTGNAAAQAAG